ncbi:hypothetical protein L596_023280 [Steinernema carpocapsae]|uniref:Uncharacterized protein n=1 Tax=Steinernema carpocapsae TaxID=34508 RepID=A0A4U5MDZ1_STECR|nr:hypothetical protein L596_023280 [Steinernema carpocapsae]
MKSLFVVFCLLFLFVIQVQASYPNCPENNPDCLDLSCPNNDPDCLLFRRIRSSGFREVNGNMKVNRSTEECCES